MLLKNNNKKPFIPRDKPKAWVFFIIAVLVGLFISSPLMIVGIKTENNILEMLGKFLFFACSVVCAAMTAVGIIQNIRGKYDKIEERDWNDQVW